MVDAARAACRLRLTLCFCFSKSNVASADTTMLHCIKSYRPTVMSVVPDHSIESLVTTSWNKAQIDDLKIHDEFCFASSCSTRR
jgi:hypothetical protein